MATTSVPTAPRTMVQQDGLDPAASRLDQIFQNATKSMYPRLALLEALADSRDDHKRRGSSSNDICEARRGFLDSFAYLCDIEKGGATVTAAALRKLPHRSTLWLAANEGIRPEVKVHADSILQKLRKVESGNQVEVQDDILRLAVQACDSRISHYNGIMKVYAMKCRMRLRHEMRDETVNLLRAKLRKLSEPSSNTTLVDLVNFCYAMRGADVDEISKRSRDADDDFRRLAHYIGRLGATRSSTNAVVRAMIIVPELRQISDICTVEAPEPRDVKIDQEQMSPYEIVRDICMKSTSQIPSQIQVALEAIVELDSPLNANGPRAHLTSRKNITTRVHAELQLADRFSRSKLMNFVKDDKYIGCSKPACYFCYNWLSNHKHKYILPATHNRIIPGCRGPDNDINEAGAVVLKQMYAKICGNLDQRILDFLLTYENRSGHFRHQYMSTEGSSRAPSRISAVPVGVNTR